MPGTLVEGRGPSAANEAQDDKLMGSHEAALAEEAQAGLEASQSTEVEADQIASTTGELKEQFSQPAVEDQERNVPVPRFPDQVPNKQITDLRAGNKEVSSRRANLKELFDAGEPVASAAALDRQEIQAPHKEEIIPVDGSGENADASATLDTNADEVATAPQKKKGIMGWLQGLGRNK